MRIALDYLLCLLELLKGAPEKRHQRVLLYTLYMELCISKLTSVEASMNEVGGRRLIGAEKKRVEELEGERERVLGKIRNLLAERDKDLDMETVFELLKAHGRLDAMVKLARDKGDCGFVVKHYVDRREYDCVLSELANIKDVEKRMGLMKQYFCVLITNCPEETFRLLADKFRSIDVIGAVPSLTKMNAVSRRSALEYIEVAKQRTEDKFLHNLQLFLLALNEKDKQELVDFMCSEELKQRLAQSSLVDPSFAVNLCKYFNNKEGLVYAYAMLECYEAAVKLAVKIGKFDLAETYTNLIPDDFTKKRVWMKIAKLSARKSKAKLNLKIIHKCKFLNIKDIISLVMPKLKLKVLRDDLLNLLRKHDEKTEKIFKVARKHGQQYSSLYTQTYYSTNRGIKVPASQLCTSCNFPLFASERIFVFPCTHCFHTVSLWLLAVGVLVECGEDFAAEGRPGEDGENSGPG